MLVPLFTAKELLSLVIRMPHERAIKYENRVGKIRVCPTICENLMVKKLGTVSLRYFLYHHAFICTYIYLICLAFSVAGSFVSRLVTSSIPKNNPMPLKI